MFLRWVISYHLGLMMSILLIWDIQLILLIHFILNQINLTFLLLLILIFPRKWVVLRSVKLLLHSVRSMESNNVLSVSKHQSKGSWNFFKQKKEIINIWGLTLCHYYTTFIHIKYYMILFKYELYIFYVIIRCIQTLKMWI